MLHAHQIIYYIQIIRLSWICFLQAFAGMPLELVNKIQERPLEAVQLFGETSDVNNLGKLCIIFEFFFVLNFIKTGKVLRLRGLSKLAAE